MALNRPAPPLMASYALTHTALAQVYNTVIMAYFVQAPVARDCCKLILWPLYSSITYTKQTLVLHVDLLPERNVCITYKTCDNIRT